MFVRVFSGDWGKLRAFLSGSPFSLDPGGLSTYPVAKNPHCIVIGIVQELNHLAIYLMKWVQEVLCKSYCCHFILDFHLGKVYHVLSAGTRGWVIDWGYVFVYWVQV